MRNVFLDGENKMGEEGPTRPRLDSRVLEILQHCEQVTEETSRSFLEVVNSHARALEKDLRRQVYQVTSNAISSGEGYRRTIFLTNFCPYAFGRSCEYGPKSR